MSGDDALLGKALSHYRVLEKLGEGGMGVVYRALDTRLERTVALKVLPPRALGDPERKARFIREARAASALNHSSIVTVYEVDSDRDVDFIAMEYVDGELLHDRLTRAPLSLDQALSLGRGIAGALAAAHLAGIVHRDVKPGNVMVTDAGGIKVLDFGLAKVVHPPLVDPDDPTRSETFETEQGVVLGTRAYMSPEQASGLPVDARSDVFSLGVLLYEMLCGRRPFAHASPIGLLGAIVHEAPPPPRSLRPDLPHELERVLLRCLEKDPVRRFASAVELARELAVAESSLAARRRRRLGLRRWAGVAAGLVLAVGAGLGLYLRDLLSRRDRDGALVEMDRRTQAGDNPGAFRLAREALGRHPADPQLEQALARVTFPTSLDTDPEGAQVFVKGYLEGDLPWQLLGTTPLRDVPQPYALMRVRLTKEGFDAFEGTRPSVTIRLDPEGTRPAGMVRVPGGTFSMPVLSGSVGDFWLDQHEVTNAAYKKFRDEGGYANRDLWQPPFVSDGRTLGWNDAMARLRDRTGQPGPAAWEVGTYPEGQAEHPVAGVSWYEAAAYCRSVGKQLPTIYHWYRAGPAAAPFFGDILTLSNFGSSGPAPVGSHRGLGGFGTYDLAGNVKEWCWNESAGHRYVMGGAAGEPTYLYYQPEALPPMSRPAHAGFRCARYIDPLDERLAAAIAPPRKPEPRPVADDVFAAYRSIYSYARSELHAVTEATEEAPAWRKERIAIDAAYGNRRLTLHVFLPKGAAGPHQVVVFFPGTSAFYQPSSETLDTPFLFDFVPKAGRVLVYPVYDEMHQGRVPAKDSPHDVRDRMIHWSQDLGRTLDYLETRPDIDRGRMAFYGFSGSRIGPIFDAVDRRFRASILLACGLSFTKTLPEADVVNFAPRSRAATLMLNGRDDFLLPLETSQRPLFRLLGAPADRKKHVLLDSGHCPGRVEIVREVLSWLDEQMGPVGTH